MNKKLQNGLVAAVAATMGSGIVAPVFAAAATTTNFDAQYKAAYDATVLAQTSKTQKDMTAARVLVDGLYQALPTELKSLAATLSGMLDGLQQPLLVKTVDAIKLAQTSGKQVDVNTARALIVDMPTVWKNSYSSAIDTAQNVVIKAAADAITAAQNSGIQADLDKATAAYNELLTVTNNDGVKTWASTALKAELDKVVVAAKISSLNAIGAKKLEVKFNQVVDTTKATISVKKGSVAVSTDSIVFADDKKSAVITTTTNLTKGDYVVTVSGLTAAALTSTVTAEDVKVAKINITSTTAPEVAGNAKQAIVRYQVLNQYGEKMIGQTINWTISTGVAVSNETNTTGNGSFVVTAAAGADFIPGSTVYITGVHAASGTVVNANVNIALESKADSVTFKGIYNTTTSKIESLPAGFTNGKYVLLFQVNDQYGNLMASPSLSDLVFTSNNPLFVSATGFASAGTVVVDSVTYQAVTVVAGTSVNNGGDLNVQVISKVTGKTSTYTTHADAVASVKTFAISASDKIVAEGEKIEIPFTAVDQYGNAITKYTDLTTGTPVQLSSGLAFEQQNDGSAKLYYTAPASVGATATNDVPVYLTSLVTNGGSFSSLMVNVKQAAKPVAVIGVDSDVVTSIAKGNSTSIKGENLIVQDQYGRVMSDTKVNAWLDASASNKIVVGSTYSASGDVSPFTVVSTLAGFTTDNGTNKIDSSTDKFTMAAKTGTGLDATETLVFSLEDASGAVSASAKSVVFTKVDKSAYVSYTVNDLGTMYNDGGATSTTAVGFNKTVKVYGVKADGTKVLLPASDYTVTTDGKLAVAANVISDVTTGGYVTATDFTDASSNAKTVSVNVLVTVNDSNGAALAVIEKPLTVSHATPKVTTIALDSDLVTDGKATATANVITNAQLNSVIDTTNLLDQYGVVITEAPVVTITNLSKVDGSTLTVVGNGTTAANITGATMGDKFTATYKYASGQKVSVDYTVGLDTAAPELVSTSVDGTNKIVTLTFSENLVNNTASAAALASAITVDLDNNVTDDYVALQAGDVVSVTGNKIVITFASALTPASANKLSVAANTVKDAAGNLTGAVTVADVD